MSEAPSGGSVFRVPTNAQEFSALGLALLAVFVLVQFGAPIVREFDFLDQKIRDFFIGGAFASFPLIHQGAKRTINGFKGQTPVRPDLSPWFVSGAFAAMLLFAWAQFVSFLGGLSIGMAFSSTQTVDMSKPEVVGAIGMSILAMSLPLTAVVSVYAGILLNRNTRSHVFGALAFAALLYVASNALTTWVISPDYFASQIAIATAGGLASMVQFAIGMALVGVIVFVFGAVGVFISRFLAERSIGKVMVAARRLPPAERELLAAEITDRIEAGMRAGTLSGKVQLMTSPKAPPQLPTAAEP